MSIDISPILDLLTKNQAYLRTILTLQAAFIIDNTDKTEKEVEEMITDIFNKSLDEIKVILKEDFPEVYQFKK